MTTLIRRLRRHRDLDLLRDPALAPMHAALTADAAPAEVVGGHAALVAFRAVSWERAATGAPSRRPSWRPAVLSSLLASKLATALAVGAVGLSGTATAAYTGNLPDTLQDVAHDTIKAPAAHHEKAVGPDAEGEAAYGLCTAFTKEREHGKAAEKSVAFRNVAAAAGGADKIETYCATVPKPSGSPEAEQGKPDTTGQPDTVGKPDTAGKPDDAGKPETTGKPDTVPPQR